jgi:hypothetical protein
MRKMNTRARKNSVMVSWGILSLGISAISAAATWLVKDQTQQAVRTFLPPVSGAAAGYLLGYRAKMDDNAKIAATVLGGALGYYVSTLIDEHKRRQICESSWWWANPSCYFTADKRTGLYQLSDEKRKMLDEAAAQKEQL